MKRKISFVLALFTVLSMSAEYVNYFQNGMEWICSISYMKYPASGGIPELDSYISKYYLAPGTGDYSSGELVLFEENNTGTIALAAIECEDEKIFFRKSGMDGKYLMYDFGLQPGDEKEFFVIPGFNDAPVSFTAKCVDVEEKTVGDRTFPIIRFANSYTGSTENDVIEEYWISGLGSFRGVARNITGLLPGAASSLLIKAKLNGEIIFDSGISGVSANINNESREVRFYLPDGSFAPEGYKGLVISSEGKKILNR